MHRDHLQVTDDTIVKKSKAAITKVAAVIAEVLRYKLKTVSEALESLTRFGSDNAEETKQKTKLLYDLWSLQCASKEIK